MPLWKPTDLGSNTAALWLRSETITQEISKWKDSSGKGNTVSPGVAPSRLSKNTNNKDTFRFTASSSQNFLVATHSGPQGLPLDVGTGDFYMGAFVKIPTSINAAETAPQSILSKDATGSAFDFRMNGSEHIIMATSGNQTKHTGITLPANNEYHWVFCYRTGSDMTVGHADSSVGGKVTTATNSDNLTEASEFIVGARQSTGDGSIEKEWDGEIAEVIVLHYCPSASERDIIEGYIHHKYGELAKLDSGHPYKTANVDLTSCHCVTEDSLSTGNLSSNLVNAYEITQSLNIKDERNE